VGFFLPAHCHKVTDGEGGGGGRGGMGKRSSKLKKKNTSKHKQDWEEIEYNKKEEYLCKFQ
jgi:hypothetical protein